MVPPSIEPVPQPRRTRAVRAAIGGVLLALGTMLPAPGALAQPVTLSIADTSGLEGTCVAQSTPFWFRFALSRASSNAVTFHVQPRGVTAGTSDFSAGGYDLQINPGFTEVVWAFSVFGDFEVEPDETFEVVLSNVQGAEPADSVAIGTIVNDDAQSSDGLHLLQVWPGSFTAPRTVAARLGREIWIADWDRVRAFSRGGAPLEERGPLEQPGVRAIAFDSTDVFTVDTWVRKWTVAGQPLWTLTHPNATPSGTPGGGGPRGIAVDPTGFVYVADTRGWVHRVTREGVYVDRWAVASAERITLGPDRLLYVSTTDDLVRIFDLSGAQLAVWGGAGSCPFQEIMDVGVDRGDRVSVLEYNHRIRRFTRAGVELPPVVGFGSAPGQFHYPEAMAVDDEGIVYVADTGNHRIQRFATADTTPPEVSCPADLVIPCGPGGAVVTFDVPAEDGQDPAPVVTCVPASGSKFPVGATTVQCTAVDIAGNQATCSFQVVVQGAGCPDVSDVQIQSLAVACSDGDTTVQYVELNASHRSAFSAGLVLRVYDHAGQLRWIGSDLFPGRAEGEEWPARRRWLIATSRFATRLMTPDREAPLHLDLYGGRLTLEIPDAQGHVLVDEVAYGVPGTLPPLPGRALARQGNGLDEVTSPSVTRFDETAVGFDCTCPFSSGSTCATTNLDVPVFEESRPCACGGTAQNGFDLFQGMVHAGVHADCKSGGGVSRTTSDVFWISGPPPGTAVPIAAVFTVSLQADAMLPPPFGQAYARATLECLGQSLVVTTGSQRDTTLRIPIVVRSHQPFGVSLSIEASAIGTASGSGRLAFEGPAGVEIASCYGYGDPIVFTDVRPILLPPRTALTIEPPRPNPSRGRFQVAFRLPSAGAARLAVHDVSGRAIHARDLTGLAAGRHVIELALPPRVPAGLYFLKLDDGRSRATRRVLVTR